MAVTAVIITFNSADVINSCLDALSKMAPQVAAIVVDNAVFLDSKIPAEGPIELQVHGTPLWFRNIFVRELTSPKK